MATHAFETTGVTICSGKGLDPRARETFGIELDDVVMILHGSRDDGLEAVTVGRRDPETGLFATKFVQEYGFPPLPAEGIMDDPIEVARDILGGGS